MAARASHGAGVELAVGATDAHFETFLDRFMRAESNGRDFAANPRSTALGPFQFIKATFSKWRAVTSPRSPRSATWRVLALRTDRVYARRAAAIYSMENPRLPDRQRPARRRSAICGWLTGGTDRRGAPHAGATVNACQRDSRAPAVKANPFMAGMSASDLIARSARDVGERHHANVAMAPEPHKRTVGIQPGPRAQPRPGPAAVTATCNQKLVACRRWIAMQANKQRVAQQQTEAARKAASRSAPGKRDSRPGV